VIDLSDVLTTGSDDSPEQWTAGEHFRAALLLARVAVTRPLDVALVNLLSANLHMQAAGLLLANPPEQYDQLGGQVEDWRTT